MGMRVIYVIKSMSPRSEVKAPLQAQTQCQPVSLIERGEGSWHLEHGGGDGPQACIGLGPNSEFGFEGLSLEGFMTGSSWRQYHRF